MQEFLKEVLGSVIRSGLAFLAGWLVQQGLITQGDADQWVIGATAALVALAWSVWAKYKSRVKLNTALIAPAGITELEVKQQIAGGNAAPLVLGSFKKEW